MITPTQVGILAFALAVIFGPLYTVDEYSVVSNLISELGDEGRPLVFEFRHRQMQTMHLPHPRGAAYLAA